MKENKDYNVLFFTIVRLSICNNMMLECYRCFGDRFSLFSLVLYVSYTSSIWIYGGTAEHSSYSMCYPGSSSLYLHFSKDLSILILVLFHFLSYVLPELLTLRYYY
jgi:hypothetical protein